MLLLIVYILKITKNDKILQYIILHFFLKIHVQTICIEFNGTNQVLLTLSDASGLHYKLQYNRVK